MYHDNLKIISPIKYFEGVYDQKYFYSSVGLQPIKYTKSPFKISVVAGGIYNEETVEVKFTFDYARHQFIIERLSEKSDRFLHMICNLYEVKCSENIKMKEKIISKYPTERFFATDWLSLRSPEDESHFSYKVALSGEKNDNVGAVFSINLSENTVTFGDLNQGLQKENFIKTLTQHTMELDTKIHDKIKELSAEADAMIEDSDIAGLEKYREALALLPDPKTDWEAATWLYGALGDALFSFEDFEAAKDAFHDAYNSAGGIENPFINLRLGECYFELDDMKKAEEYMLRAFMLEGEEIFDEEDSKYVDFMNEKYDLENGGIPRGNTGTELSDKGINHESPDINLKTKVKEHAEKIAEAIVKNDFETIAFYTYPLIVEMLGGKEKMIALMQQGTLDMHTKGFSWISATIGEPEEIQETGGFLYTLVPQTIRMKTPQATAGMQTGHLLAVSPDKGSRWYYIDTVQLSGTKLGQIFPALVGKVVIPG